MLRELFKINLVHFLIKCCEVTKIDQITVFGLIAFSCLRHCLNDAGGI